jgi:hypothetical protein
LLRQILCDGIHHALLFSIENVKNSCLGLLLGTILPETGFLLAGRRAVNLAAFTGQRRSRIKTLPQKIQ